MKKIYLNIFFQIIALVFIIKVVFFDDVNYDKFAILKTEKFIILLLFSVGVHFLLTYLFFKIINIVSLKKIKYLDITSIHMQGAIVNQILPGLGYLFRYFKLKLNSNIDILTYVISQSIWSLFSTITYICAAFIFGFILIANYLVIIVIFFLILTTLIFFIMFNHKIFSIIKKLIYKSKKLSLLINNLKDIKKSLFRNRRNLFLILIGFIILLILECFIFNLGLNYFGIDISYFQSNYIWIISTVLTLLTVINFFGMFEIVITLSAAIIVPEIKDIFIFAINLKIINMTATFLIIIYSELLKKLFNK